MGTISHICFLEGKGYIFRRESESKTMLNPINQWTFMRKCFFEKENFVSDEDLVPAWAKAYANTVLINTCTNIDIHLVQTLQGFNPFVGCYDVSKPPAALANQETVVYGLSVPNTMQNPLN